MSHARLRVGPPAGGDVTTLIVTGVPWRTAWRYSERAFRHIYWDAGGRCSRRRSRSPTRPGWHHGCGRVSRMATSDGLSAPTARTSSKSRWSRSATARPRSNPRTEIEPLLGEPLVGLLLTCVGVPAYRNKGGGKPDAPSSVVVPMPGLTPPVSPD